MGLCYSYDEHVFENCVWSIWVRVWCDHRVGCDWLPGQAWMNVCRSDIIIVGPVFLEWCERHVQKVPWQCYTVTTLCGLARYEWWQSSIMCLLIGLAIELLVHRKYVKGDMNKWMGRALITSFSGQKWHSDYESRLWAPKDRCRWKGIIGQWWWVAYNQTWSAKKKMICVDECRHWRHSVDDCSAITGLDCNAVDHHCLGRVHIGKVVPEQCRYVGSAVYVNALCRQ